MAAREFISNEFNLRTYEEAFAKIGRSRQFASYLARILNMCGEENWPTWGVAWARQNMMELWIAVHRAYQNDYLKQPVPLHQPFPHSWMAPEYGGSPQFWQFLLEPLDRELGHYYLWAPRIQWNIQRMMIHTGKLLINLRKGKYGETPPSNIQRAGKCYGKKVNLSLFLYSTLPHLKKFDIFKHLITSYVYFTDANLCFSSTLLY